MKKQRCAIFEDKSLKINVLTIKIIVKLEITVIMQLNIEVPHIAYVIWNIVYLKKLP